MGGVFVFLVVVFLVGAGLAALIKMMTNKQCPACRKDIDGKATKCPYCQTLLTA